MFEEEQILEEKPQLIDDVDDYRELSQKLRNGNTPLVTSKIEDELTQAEQDILGLNLHYLKPTVEIPFKIDSTDKKTEPI